MLSTRLFLLLLALATVFAGDWYNGPFASWVNVKDAPYNAVGDGVTDDTAALKAALAKLELGASGSHVVFLPAGTYRITSTLTLNDVRGSMLIGDDPATTKILWDGPTGGFMLTTNSVTNSRFARITWNGNKKAATLINHKWDGSSGVGCSSMMHFDEFFEGATGIAIDAGQAAAQVSETTVLRCRFNGIPIGVSLNNGNVLNWWFRDSYFANMGVAAIKANGGDFFVRNCIFVNNSGFDMYFNQSTHFSVRGSVSYGSKQSLKLDGNAGYWAHLLMAKNKLQGPVGPLLEISSMSAPLVLLDNEMMTWDSYSTVYGWARTRVFIGEHYKSQGNQTGWYLNGPIPELNLIDNDFNFAVTKIAEPQPVPVPAKVTRPIIEVAGSTGADLQAAIDSAAAMIGQKPIVHLGVNTFTLNATVTIPKGADMQLVGDGWQSRVQPATGYTGALITVNGPSYVSFRNFFIYGQTANGVVVTEADQFGSQVFMQNCLSSRATVSGYHFDGMQSGTAMLHECSGGSNMPSQQALRVSGPAAVTNTAKVFALAGTYGAANPVFQVDNGGWLKVTDGWDESPYALFFRGIGAGTFAGESMRWATYQGVDTSLRAVDVDQFKGSAVFLNNYLSTPLTKAISIAAGDANRKVLFLGSSGDGNWIEILDQTGATRVISCNQDAGGQKFLGNLPVNFNSSNPPADVVQFIRNMLVPSRENEPVYTDATTASGPSNLFFDWVEVQTSQIGFHFTGSATAQTPSPGQSTTPGGTTAPVSTTAPTSSTTAPTGSTTAPTGSTTAPSGSTTAPTGTTTKPGTTKPTGTSSASASGQSTMAFALLVLMMSVFYII